jgi:hypothetical protein
MTSVFVLVTPAFVPGYSHSLPGVAKYMGVQLIVPTFTFHGVLLDSRMRDRDALGRANTSRLDPE